MYDIETGIERVNSKNKLNDFVSMLFDEEENKNDDDIMGDIKLSSLLRRYLELFGLSVSDDYSEFVPIDFDLSPNIELKCRVLQEAIDNNKKIYETSLYPSLVDDVIIDDKSSGVIK